MGDGVVLQPAAEVLAKLLKGKEDYFLFRLCNLPGDSRCRLVATAWSLALQMKDLNVKWKFVEGSRRKLLIELLPIPGNCKLGLLQKWGTPTGYNWAGLFSGKMPAGRWTCVSICLYLVSELQLTLEEFGVGVFGLMGLLDPIKPIDFITRKGFGRLFTENDAQNDPLFGEPDDCIVELPASAALGGQDTVRIPRSCLA